MSDSCFKQSCNINCYIINSKHYHNSNKMYAECKLNNSKCLSVIGLKDCNFSNGFNRLNKTYSCSVIFYFLTVLISLLIVKTTADTDLLKRQFSSQLHKQGSSQALPSQIITPSQCNIKCKSLKQRPFCASDGKTYASKCELRKVIKCGKRDITIVAKGRCGANRGSRGNNNPVHNCTDERNKLLASRVNRQDVYIPSCHPNGSYTAVQCYQASGNSAYCWCVTGDGKPIPRTSVKESTPDCSQGGRKTSCKKRRGKACGASKKKCGRKDRVNFTTNLVQLFVEDYSRSSVPVADDHENKEIDVITWKYKQLDKNKDDVLKSNELQSLRRMARRMVKPKSCAKRFPKYCDEDKNNIISQKEWSSCLSDSVNISFRLFLSLNSDDKPGSPSKEVIGGDGGGGSGTNRRPSQKIDGENQAGPTLYDRQPGVELPVTQGRPDMPETQPSSHTDCFESRRQEEDNEKTYPNGQIFVPECVEGGLYKKDQCHKYTGYCWCVDEHTGKPIPGYSTRHKSPDCSQAMPERELKGQADIQPFSNRRPIPGCPYPQKRKYIIEVLDTLTKQMMDYADTHPGIQLNPNGTIEETAVKWKFKMLDSNSNQQLDRKETKSIKNLLKTNVQSQGHTKLRKCARNFLRFCDENSNGKISINEWEECLHLSEVSKQEADNDNSKRKGINPLTQFLKS